MTPDWTRLGLYLGIDNTTLEIIESNNPRIQDCHQKTLSTWLRRGGANRNTLIQALEKMNRGYIKDTIWSHDGISGMYNYDLHIARSLLAPHE